MSNVKKYERTETYEVCRLSLPAAIQDFLDFTNAVTERDAGEDRSPQVIYDDNGIEARFPVSTRLTGGNF